jgi:hypothetical protein
MKLILDLTETQVNHLLNLMASSDNECFVNTMDELRLAVSDSKEQIYIVWSVTDVMSQCPRLNEEQALEVLRMAKSKHDCNVGINWEVLEHWANSLFPEMSEEEED